jgi:hypothetical protein
VTGAREGSPSVQPGRGRDGSHDIVATLPGCPSEGVAAICAAVNCWSWRPSFPFESNAVMVDELQILIPEFLQKNARARPAHHKVGLARQRKRQTVKRYGTMSPRPTLTRFAS